VQKSGLNFDQNGRSKVRSRSAQFLFRVPSLFDSSLAKKVFPLAPTLTVNPPL